MKKVYLAAAVLALIFGFSYCYKKDKTEKTATEKEAVVNEVKNEEMIVPGYALGEIPAISIPEIPNLSVSENPDAKITLDMAKKISSVPGITISPVKVEDGNIVGGSYSMQIGKNGDGQYSDKNKSVQTDGNGAGQYEDDKITIQRDEDGAGQYINKVTGVTLQVDKDGAGQYIDEKNDLSIQVNKDGTGLYTDKKNNVTIYVNENDVRYVSTNIEMVNNGDGSGTYTNKSKNLVIENNGKGKAKITFNGQTTEVDAKPLEKPGKLAKLEMVPPVPSIEANSLLIALDSEVLFDVNKYDVRVHPEAEEVLKNLAIVLKEMDVKNFEIDGHTDSDGSDEYNQVLSEKRANSVKNFLVSQGVTAEITTKGYGESKPVASNDTAEGKQKNRRVEIIIPTN
ncbi:OmpA family protein [Fusobacterium pseudoperiodonticum]|uniref:OmpA family protein n=1 Tax=Fusobacterium pseudoperiodonticum TaxID=2663009 RepID=UPI000C1BEC46|nr:OmpA family protein [Fusobacterium pseudoperiodonticum]ATV63589.1 porin [Fusobacterium pseudoperiodonticum]